MKLFDHKIAENAFLSLIPTGLGYVSAVKDFGQVTAIIACVVIFTILFFIFQMKSINEYQNAVVKVLATGYFFHCIEKISKNLRSDADNVLEFNDHSNMRLPLEKIEIIILLPKTTESLNKFNDDLKSNKNLKIVYINSSNEKSSSWFRAEKNGDGIIIKDFPNTLFSLPQYLSGPNSYKKNSQKYHKLFIERIDELFEQNIGNHILNKFKREYV